MGALAHAGGRADEGDPDHEIPQGFLRPEYDRLEKIPEDDVGKKKKGARQHAGAQKGVFDSAEKAQDLHPRFPSGPFREEGDLSPSRTDSLMLLFFAEPFDFLDGLFHQILADNSLADLINRFGGLAHARLFFIRDLEDIRAEVFDGLEVSLFPLHHALPLPDRKLLARFENDLLIRALVNNQLR